MISPQTADSINASFEFICVFTCWGNVWKLYKDKTVNGVLWTSTLLYVIWGLWHSIYFSVLDQPWSFIGNILSTSGQVVWLMLYFYYKFKSGDKPHTENCISSSQIVIIIVIFMLMLMLSDGDIEKNYDNKRQV